MENEKIRQILDEAYERDLISFGTYTVAVKAINNRIKKVFGKENDCTKEIKFIELVDEMMKQ